MKFVILVLAVLLLLWMLFGRSRRGDRADRRPPRSTPPTAQAEGMVACAHCGVHLPRSEAVLAGALAYCSRAHREAGPRSGGP